MEVHSDDGLGNSNDGESVRWNEVGDENAAASEYVLDVGDLCSVGEDGERAERCNGEGRSHRSRTATDNLSQHMTYMMNMGKIGEKERTRNKICPNLWKDRNHQHCLSVSREKDDWPGHHTTPHHTSPHTYTYTHILILILILILIHILILVQFPLTWYE